MKHVKKIFEKLNSFIKYNLQLYFVFFFGAFRISKKKNIPNMKIIIIVGIIEVKSSFKTTVLKILKILVDHNAVFQIYAGQEAYVNKYSYDNFLNSEGLPEVFLCF